MSENNAAKGIGGLALLALLAGKSCRSCDTFGDDFLRSCSRNIDQAPQINYNQLRPIDVPEDEFDRVIPSDINGKKKVGLTKNQDGTYLFREKIHLRFEDIPFNSSDQIYVNHELTQKEVDNLMEKGVKFVFNNPAFLAQKDSFFRVVFLISNDINEVKRLYDLDDFHAKKLIEYAKDIEDKETIIKVSSFEKLIEVQNELIENNIVPVLIFHNGSESNRVRGINPESNLITCNSFQITPNSYLTSVNLLDMRSVIKATNDSYSKQTLERFYEEFATSYHSEIMKNHRNSTLILLTGGAGVLGGVSAIAYYKKN